MKDALLQGFEPQSDGRSIAQTTSYWTVPEQNEFPALLKYFGTDWYGIAKHMPTKTHIMIKNYYQRLVDSGKGEWEDLAKEANDRRETGFHHGKEKAMGLYTAWDQYPPTKKSLIVKLKYKKRGADIERILRVRAKPSLEFVRLEKARIAVQQKELRSEQDEEPVLPQGNCHYILLHPEVKGLRCACVRYSLNRLIPGSTCDCGHQAYYHEPVQADIPKHFNLNVVAPELDMERRQDPMLVGDFMEINAGIAFDKNMLSRLDRKGITDKEAARPPGWAYHSPALSREAQALEQLPRNGPGLNFPSPCFLCVIGPTQEVVFDSIDDYNVHLWQKHMDLTKWQETKCIWEGCSSLGTFATAKLWFAHVRSVHQKNFWCTSVDCEYRKSGPNPKPFGSQNTLNRHSQTHADPVYCMEPGCTGRDNIARSDKKKKHNIEYHGEILCGVYGCPRSRHIKEVYFGFSTNADLVAHQRSKHADMNLAYGMNTAYIGQDSDGDNHFHGSPPFQFPAPFSQQMPSDIDQRPTFISGQNSHGFENFTDSGIGSTLALTVKALSDKQVSYLAALQESSKEDSEAKPLKAPAAEDHSDTQTLLSDTSSLRDPKLGEYVTELADAICRAFPPSFNETDLARISAGLPVLLKEFAVRLGDDGSSHVYGQLKHLVYRYHRSIISHFQHEYGEKDDGDLPLRADEMTLNDKMTLWQNNDDKEPEVIAFDNGSDEGEDDHDQDFEPDSLDLSEFRRALTDGPAYTWLRCHLQIQSDLEIPGPLQTKNEIRNQIVKKIGRPHKISRRARSPVHTIMFDLEWNPIAFYQEQQYKETLSEVLSHAVTLTGSGNNVQATTCLQYLSQTWPETGVHFLQLLQRCIGTRTVHSGTFPDNTHLTVYDYPTQIRVSATGNAFSVAEVGEQLAWLGAALRSSPNDQEVAYCKPFISEITSSSCKFDFEIQTKGERDDTSSGDCWQNLFRNPMVVIGYPIPRRPVADRGLEVSLDIMVTLANTRRLIDFCGRTFVKGFSAMLTVMEVIEDTVFWHLFYNEDRSYISYSDPRILRNPSSPQSLAIKNPDSKRHILGWCESIRNYAGNRISSMFPTIHQQTLTDYHITGAHDANYDIGWSGLSSPNQTCAFEKVSVSTGKIVSVGVSCAIGIKDKSIRVDFGDDYVSMLSMISKRHFVFHDLDEEDRRAWLVDGASALLHLLRASLKHYQNDRHLQRIFCFDFSELEEARTTHTGADAAFEVLLNVDNQQLSLYSKMPESWREKTIGERGKQEEVLKEKTVDFCLKDRVDQICNILGQIMAHQDDVSSQSGVGFRLKTTPQRQLEGFDFMDVATGQGTLWPKVATLRASGAGWVDFTRKIHAISLFGTGFGDLLAPANNRAGCGSCLWNEGVPKGKDYLAVPVAELKDIIRTKGNMRRNPWRVVDDIYWHTPDMTFERCGCLQSRSAKHDRVQVFLPATFPKMWGRNLKSPSKLASDGAVIFGHSWKFPLRWGVSGNPEEGNPLPSIEGGDPVFYDSGIGSAQSASSSERPSDSPNPLQPSNGCLASDPRLYKLSNQQFIHQDASTRTGVTPEIAALQLLNSMEEPEGSRKESKGRAKRSISPTDVLMTRQLHGRGYDHEMEQIPGMLAVNEPRNKRRRHEFHTEDLSEQRESRRRKGKERAP
ncbi:uncharacterized protein LY89DRAFT_735500 [Mollisia scopiformis]|uniref:Myb-like domain-containing protein n=1 Tax=Mollisia scopiformis TaxID=149040 RepID=A0A194X5N2_MOLSC|nr:uncharacterized protein LY89DRAFT_735500 [Mollisia scopiformis]KUJ15384.1 hypothetical protein LY89DRAFT_735500 [Mollisia scopiformis]